MNCLRCSLGELPGSRDKRPAFEHVKRGLTLGWFSKDTPLKKNGRNLKIIQLKGKNT